MICQGVDLCVIFVYPDFVTAVATAAVSLGKPPTPRLLWALPAHSPPPALLGPVRPPTAPRLILSSVCAPVRGFLLTQLQSSSPLCLVLGPPAELVRHFTFQF